VVLGGVGYRDRAFVVRDHHLGEPVSIASR
jgi:hypothetical protein